MGIDKICQNDDDVIVTIDGDDWLKHDRVFETVDCAYRENEIMLTFGSHEHYPSGEFGLNNGCPPEETVEFARYRLTRWMYSHLRTFKYLLWKNIRDEDLRDENGAYYSMTWDLAFMLPMLEMAGKQIMHIPEVLYVYNMETPFNDHKKDSARQQHYDRLIRSKPIYSRL